MIKNKNRYLNTGLLLWGLVTLLLHAGVAANDGTDIETGGIVFNFLICYYLVQADWIKKRFVESNNSRVKLVVVGVSCSFVIFIVQSILGAIVFA